MTTYTLQAIDGEGHLRDTFRIEAQRIGDVTVVRIPAHWPASEADALRNAIPGPIVIVPDYIQCFRLVKEPTRQPSPPPEWTQE